MSDLQMLFRLQELDLQVEAQNTALLQTESALGETEELNAARAQVDSLRELLHDQELRLRELEWDADKLSGHMTVDEQKLYGGKVSNPKELAVLQRDLEQSRNQRSQIEENELQLMAGVEVTTADLQKAQEELAAVRAAWEERQRELAARQTEVSEKIESLRAARAQLGAIITGANISLYEKLRREKRGRAVSKIERSTCLGCRIALPMAVVQRVRSGREFVYCPSCGRLLYI